MMKKRKAFYQLEKWYESNHQSVAMVLGIRRVGKSTVLKQFAEAHGGYYVNFKETPMTTDEYERLFDRPERLLCFDEIGYVRDYDMVYRDVHAELEGRRLVITGSSYGALSQLGVEHLGCRSDKIEMFPLSFEEYLYFSGRISAYGEKYTPTENDIQDFYRLKGIPEGMQITISEGYLLELVKEMQTTADNLFCDTRHEVLSEDLAKAVCDVLAYTLNRHVNVRSFGETIPGKQEYTSKALRKTGIDLSSSLIGQANKVAEGLSAEKIAQALCFLLSNGFAFVDLWKRNDEKQTSDLVLGDLSSVKDEKALDEVLKKYTLSVISPLMYSRLLCDIEVATGLACTNSSLYGALYELAIKSEDIYKHGYYRLHKSYKYTDNANNYNVDLISNGSIIKPSLYLEATITHKKAADCSVHRVYPEREAYRILTDLPGVSRVAGNGTFYRLGYPETLLLLSRDNRDWDIPCLTGVQEIQPENQKEE
jgi:hypothetical protein